MPSSKAKIFGIGLSKTGTTSLANALQILGYKTKDNIGVVKYETGDLSSVDLDLVDAHDALTDTPIPSFYRELDARFPESKFILTVRDSDGWLMSCRKQFTQRDSERQNEAHKRLFIDLYGTEVFDAQGFADGYRRFVEGVRDYFKDRPQDLLILDISGGEGWEKLCTFLDRPVPDVPFPKANVTQIRWMNIDDVITVAKRGGAELMRRFEHRHGTDAYGDNGEPSRARAARRFLEAAMRTLRTNDSADVATRRAHNVIVAGLTKLNPRIPVVSRTSVLAAYPERREWNHYWLVDPLDGEAAFARGSGNFSINIALIEDGQPIYGVVYAPAMDMTYYGRAGKGGYRRTDGEAPVPLARQRSHAQPAVRSGASLEQHDSTNQQGKTSSHGLAICKLAEGEDSDDWVLQPSMQWQTAAAHAILRSAGLRICDAESGEELSYNKEDFAIATVKIT